MSLCTTGLEFLVPEGVMLPQGDTTMIPLNWKPIMPLSHLRLLISLNQQAKKGVTVYNGVIDFDY